MIAIIKASRDYEGLAWVNYDTLYRRRAAATNFRTWSQINSSLFALCFTGKAQTSQRCDLCGEVSRLVIVLRTHRESRTWLLISGH